MRKPICQKDIYHHVEMNYDHDAYYCVECDVWLEEGCSSPDCELCVLRPERPSDCAGE